jgi:hypothetical protein
MESNMQGYQLWLASPRIRLRRNPIDTQGLARLIPASSHFHRADQQRKVQQPHRRHSTDRLGAGNQRIVYSGNSISAGVSEPW